MISTRLESLLALRDSGGVVRQQDRVLLLLSEAPHLDAGCTRRKVADLLGLQQSAATARVNELVKLGLLEEGASITCPVTSKRVGTVRLPHSLRCWQQRAVA